jgi:hypothetical protein
LQSWPGLTLSDISPPPACSPVCALLS